MKFLSNLILMHFAVYQGTKTKTYLTNRIEVIEFNRNCNLTWPHDDENMYQFKLLLYITGLVF